MHISYLRFAPLLLRRRGGPATVKFKTCDHSAAGRSEKSFLKKWINLCIRFEIEFNERFLSSETILILHKTKTHTPAHKKFTRHGNPKINQLHNSLLFASFYYLNNGCIVFISACRSQWTLKVCHHKSIKVVGMLIVPTYGMLLQQLLAPSSKV